MAPRDPNTPTHFDQQQPNNEMNTPTTTTRTDAATYPADCLGKTLVTNRDCSRALELELATERARLDSGQIMLTVAGERVWHCGVDLRAAIDAGIKEGGA